MMSGNEGGGIVPKRWEAVRDGLAGDIQIGRLRPGDRLPPDPLLAAQYGVNRLTVRHAIQVMASDGLLHVRHGVGTFVANDVVHYSLGKRARLTPGLLGQNWLVRRVLIRKGEVTCPEAVCKLLQLRNGTSAAYICFLGLADEVPQLISTNWFPITRLPGILDSFGGLNSISEALRRCGVADYQRQWSRISARAATDDEGARLQLAAGAPVLVQKALDADGTDIPVKYGESVWRADRTEFVVGQG